MNLTERLRQQVEGRRKEATPRQIFEASRRVTTDNFANQLEVFLPTREDIQVKEEGLRRRHHTRKPR